MPHGGPDWGTLGPLATVYTIEDMAELAARLGSIVTFDRRGNIIWMDDFESGIPSWIITGATADYAVDWCSKYARTGGFCAQLTAGKYPGYYASFRRWISYPVPGRLGAEFSFDLSDDADYFEFYFDLRDGTTVHRARLRFVVASGALQYENSTPDWVDLIVGLYFHSGGQLFKTVKLIVDFTNDTYARVIFNDATYDLTGKALFTEDGDGVPCLNVQFFLKGKTGPQALGYVDDVILTQNEP